MRRKFSAQIWLLMSSLAVINKNTLYTHKGQRARTHPPTSQPAITATLLIYVSICARHFAPLLFACWRTRPRQYFLLYLYSLLSENRCIHWKLPRWIYATTFQEASTPEKTTSFLWFIALNALSLCWKSLRSERLREIGDLQNNLTQRKFTRKSICRWMYYVTTLRS